MGIIASKEDSHDFSAQRTRDHYNKYPLEFIEPGSGLDLRNLQPPSFLAFVDTHVRPGDRVIDVGCGPGRALILLESLGLETVGCDLSEDSLSLAATRAKDSLLVQANALNLPLASESFNAVISDGVLHHTPDAMRGFVELSRVLKTRGYMYISVYKRWRYYYYFYNYLGAVIRYFNRNSVGQTIVNASLLPIYHIVHLVKSRGTRTWRGSKNFFYDYFITPRATFHSKSDVLSWGRTAGLEFVSYDRCPTRNCHAFVFRKL